MIFESNYIISPIKVLLRSETGFEWFLVRLSRLHDLSLRRFLFGVKLNEVYTKKRIAKNAKLINRNAESLKNKNVKLT